MYFYENKPRGDGFQVSDTVIENSPPLAENQVPEEVLPTYTGSPDVTHIYQNPWFIYTSNLDATSVLDTVSGPSQILAPANEPLIARFDAWGTKLKLQVTANASMTLQLKAENNTVQSYVLTAGVPFILENEDLSRTAPTVFTLYQNSQPTSRELLVQDLEVQYKANTKFYQWGPTKSAAGITEQDPSTYRYTNVGDLLYVDFKPGQEKPVSFCIPKALLAPHPWPKPKLLVQGDLKTQTASGFKTDIGKYAPVGQSTIFSLVEPHWEQYVSTSNGQTYWKTTVGRFTTGRVFGVLFQWHPNSATALTPIPRGEIVPGI